MSTVLFYQPVSRWHLKFCGFHYADRHWLVLFETSGKKVFKAWSNEDESPDMNAEQFAALIVRASNGLSSVYDVDDTFLQTPDRWQYWGSGIPAPIEAFYETKLASVIQQQSS